MNKTIPLLTADELSRSAGEASRTKDAGFGCLDTPRGALPLKSMDVQTRVDALVARTELRQTFVNNVGEALEATYIFPLPDRAAVTSFRMEVAGRVIEGLLKERSAARREYADAIEKGHRAAITEEERPDVFTIRVGNILAGESATVELSLTAPLPCRDGEAELRFPLVVAPRYIPGVPLDGESVGDGTEVDTDAVPDASRITPPVLLEGYPNPVRLSLEVSLNPGGLPLGEIRSSLHAVVSEDGANGARRIRLAPGERLNRDFILRFRLAADSVKTSLVVEPDQGAEGKAGTFLFTLVPPVMAPVSRRPRDIVFVLDRSGSMQGWKITAARRAVERMVETLRDEDRFSVYAFDGVVETPPSFGGMGLVAGSGRHRVEAAAFLASINSRGGTEIARPLTDAVRALNDADGNDERDRVLVLVTDGQVGNEDQILRELGSGLKRVRVFALGIDRAVNEGFLKRLAAAGGGHCELVESESRLDDVMDRIHQLIATPVLTDLRMTSSGLDIEPGSVVPARLPGLFAGVPVLIQGRWSGDSAGSITLEARDAAGRPWSETARAVRGSSGAAAPIWARGRIRDLEDRYAAAVGGADREKIEKEIVGTSLRFHVLSRFTAYVAVDRSEVANAGGKVHKILQPVEAPEGWDMLDSDEEVKVRLCRQLPSTSVGLGGMSDSGIMHYASRENRSLPLKFSPDLDLELDELLGAWRDFQKRIAGLRKSVKLLREWFDSVIQLLELRNVPVSQVEPFKRLLLDLNRAEKRWRLPRKEREALFTRCEELIQAFVKSLGVTPTVRKDFWK